jgi:hypothetical protein
VRRDGLRSTAFKVRTRIAERLSPEATRRATYLERITVARISWELLVRLNRWLVLAGKLATVVWVAFMASIVLGVEWKKVVEEAINSGRPVEGALAVAVIIPTLLFVAARSVLGFARWRIQRELWRRDVARLERR